MSINHEKSTLVIIDEYSRYTWVHFLKKKSQAPKIIMSFIRMVENQNDVKVKQIRIDNGTEFRNHEHESFCDEKGISQNFTSPYTPKQNGVAERKNRTLIEAARIMLNGSVFSKHFWTEAVRIALFIHNHKDHLGKFDAKADDGYFLGYSFVLKAFRVFNTRRQQVEETYHVTFDESMETIRFTNTSVDEIGIDDSSTYPPVEFIQEDDPSRQYQVDSDISYYIIPHGLPDVTLSHISQSAYDKLSHLHAFNEVSANKLTAALASECLFADFLFEIEPKKVFEALKHPGWIDAMQEELKQFYRNIVWTLVPLPYGKTAIGSKWVFRNKKDEHGITQKAARLVWHKVIVLKIGIGL
ncbi:retrovirus-related pol polyprotein from transposon TNT 1-94 [Tanacetum coccineum]